jgi:hypothetical protein
MATLNFDHASKFSISGGIFSPARHVTMISGGNPSTHTWYRGQGGRRRGRLSSSSRGSKRRTPLISKPFMLINHEPGPELLLRLERVIFWIHQFSSWQTNDSPDLCGTSGKFIRTSSAVATYLPHKVQAIIGMIIKNIFLLRHPHSLVRY